jgi:hypothetical protein
MVKNEIKTKKTNPWLDDYLIDHTGFLRHSIFPFGDVNVEIGAIDKSIGCKRTTTIWDIAGIESGFCDERRFYSSVDFTYCMITLALIISSPLSKNLTKSTPSIPENIMPFKFLSIEDNVSIGFSILN